MVHKNSSWFPRVDQASSIPLYEQLVEQVACAIASSALLAGDGLPSVRSLATDLRINPNTAARAIREMEQAGLSRPVKGVGCVVAEGAEAPARGIARLALSRELSRVVAVARRLGLGPEDIQQALDKRWQEDDSAD